MPNVGVFNNSPTQGGVNGTLVDGSNPIEGPPLLADGAEVIGEWRKLAVRTLNSGAYRPGDTTLEFVGATASAWQLAPDSSGAPGTPSAWGEPLVVAGPLENANVVFWTRSRALDSEDVTQTTEDVGVLLLVEDDVMYLVGRSLAVPFGVREAVGRSLVLPSLVLNSVGRSLVLPYEVQSDDVGRSLAIPYVVHEAVGRSLALPYSVIGAVGRSLEIPYDVLEILSTPTLTAAANGLSQIDLSCTNISNEDGYLFEWSPNGSTGWQTVEQTAANDTTCSHTGLDPGTQYFYRVKALGSGRYSDSGYGTDDATTDGPPYREDLFTDSDGVAVASHSPTGGAGSWTQAYAAGGGSPAQRIKSNVLIATVASGGPVYTSQAAVLSGSSTADCAAEVDAHLYSGSSESDQITIGCRRDAAVFASRTEYRLDIRGDGQVLLAKYVAGTYTVLDTDTFSPSPGNTYTLRVEAVGTAIKGYINGVEKVSATDSAISAGGGLEVQIGNPAAYPYTSSATGWGADAVRLYEL